MEEALQHSTKMNYVLLRRRIFKLLQFLTLLLAWVFFFAFKDQISPAHYKNWKEHSFLIVHFTGCIVALLLFLFYLAGLGNKIGSHQKRFHIFEFIFQLCLAICCAIISSQWSKWADANLYYHEALPTLYRRWIFLIIAIVFSFASCILLTADNVFILTQDKFKE